MDKLSELRPIIMARLESLDLYKGCEFTHETQRGRWLISTRQQEKRFGIFSRTIELKVLEITFPGNQGEPVRLAIKVGNGKAGDIVEDILKEAGLTVERHKLN